MRITLPTGTPAELARPDTDIEPRLGVVLFPDVMGLRPLFDDLCARLAAEHGWVVCAPEPFPGREDLPVAERMAAMGAPRRRATCGPTRWPRPTPPGASGWWSPASAWAGMLTFKAAGSGRFARAAAFYGMIRRPASWDGDALAEPIEALASPDRCPTLAIVGTVDPYTPEHDLLDAEALGVRGRPLRGRRPRVRARRVAAHPPGRRRRRRLAPGGRLPLRLTPGPTTPRNVA